MSKIKTRETGKDIKVLDKSAVVGQRMKNAFIRSKRNAAALMDDRQATPSEYAEDKVEFAADDLAHDTANMAVSGTKTAARQGRKLFQRQREKRAAEKRRENTATTEQAPAPEPFQGTAPEGQTPQRHSGTAPSANRPAQGWAAPPAGHRLHPGQTAPTPANRDSPGASANPSASPAKRVALGKEEQRNERALPDRAKRGIWSLRRRAWADFCQKAGRKVGRAETAGEKPGCPV